jgi:hypothetical protein
MKIKLLKIEEKSLDDYWEFINIFIPHWDTSKLYGPYDYRRVIIPIISKKYTIEQFYFYERVLNKMLWMLINHIDFDISKINKYEKCYNTSLYKKYGKYYGIKSKRSFSHKTFIKDDVNNLCYEYDDYMNIEKNNKTIRQICEIMRDRKLYELIMKTNKDKVKIKIKNKVIYSNDYPPYYYPCDYPFPNVNFLFYNKNNKKIWIDRINKLYYNDNKDDEWYNFTRECL